MTTLFLFAHQDDEFGVFERIFRLRQQGRSVAVAYLTSGSRSGEPHPARDQESVDVLGRLGVPAVDIHFIGSALNIPDGKLVEHMESALEACLGLAAKQGTVDEVCCLGWEGGHQDHDAVYLLGIILAKQLGILESSHQFSLYQGAGLSGSFFRLLSPLPQNGALLKSHIPRARRLLFAQLVLRYRSQWRTWIAFYPLLIIYYLVNGSQALQPLVPARARAAPHAGALLYERRGFYSAARFATFAKSFLDKAR